MPAGERRFKILIQQPVEADDGSGQPVISWSTYCTRWASVVALSGTERYRGRQIQPQMTHLIEVIADSVTRAITPGMQVLWRGRTINLQVVQPMEGKMRVIQLQGVEYVQG